MIGSKLCLDLWRPLEITLDEALENIFPTPNEKLHGVTAEHLIDDYTLTQNIARFGLRFKSFVDIYKDYGMNFEYLAHQYTMTPQEKIAHFKETIKTWKVENCFPQE